MLKNYASYFVAYLLDNLENISNIQRIILYGSVAKNEEGKESDIDIYIETQSKKLKEEIELLNSKINVKIGKYNKDSLLIKEIEKNHVIIKGIEVFYEKNKFFN